MIAMIETMRTAKATPGATKAMRMTEIVRNGGHNKHNLDSDHTGKQNDVDLSDNGNGDVGIKEQQPEMGPNYNSSYLGLR
jgi:hypothetical protein